MAKNSLLDIKDILNEYSVDIQEALVEDAERVAKSAKKDLVQTSPKRTGKFSKSWRVAKDGKKFIVYSTNPGLAHLLEKPHLDRTGHRTIVPKSAGFIEKVDKARTNEYYEDMQRIIKNGGL